MSLFNSVPAQLLKYESVLQKMRNEEQQLAKSIVSKEKVLKDVLKDIQVQLEQFRVNEKRAQQRLPKFSQIEQGLTEKERILEAKELALKKAQHELYQTQEKELDLSKELEKKTSVLKYHEESLANQEKKNIFEIKTLEQTKKELENNIFAQSKTLDGIKKQYASVNENFNHLKKDYSVVQTRKIVQEKRLKNLAESTSLLEKTQTQVLERMQELENAENACAARLKSLRDQELAITTAVERESIKYKITKKTCLELQESLTQTKKDHSLLVADKKSQEKKLENISQMVMLLEQKKTSVEKKLSELNKTEQQSNEHSMLLREEQVRLARDVEQESKMVEQAEQVKKQIILFQSDKKKLESSCLELKKQEQCLKKDIEQATKELCRTKESLKKTLPLVEQSNKEYAFTKNLLANSQEEYSKIRAALEEGNTLLKTVQKRIAKAEKESTNAEAKCVLLREKEQELTIKSSEIDKKIQTVEEHENLLQKREIALSRQAQELAKIEQISLRVSESVAEKQKLVAETRLLFEKNESRVVEAREEETKIQQLRVALAKSKKELNERAKELQEKENDFARRQAAWLDLQKSIADAKEDLAKQHHELAEETQFKTQELSRMQQEWQVLLAHFSRIRAELSIEKKDAKQLLVTDIHSLAEREEEIGLLVKELEKDQKHLEYDQKSIIEKVRELEKTKLQYERAAKILLEREKKAVEQEELAKKFLAHAAREKEKVEALSAKVRESRDLRVDVNQLDKKYRMLSHAIELAEQKALRVGLDVAQAVDVIKQKKIVERKQDFIAKKQAQLSEKEHIFSKHKDAFAQDYLERKYTKEFPKVENAGYPEVHGLINSAKQDLDSGKLNNAARTVVELEVLSRRIADPAEKRLIDYDIRDLKTSIKLATLA